MKLVIQVAILPVIAETIVSQFRILHAIESYISPPQAFRKGDDRAIIQTKEKEVNMAYKVSKETYEKVFKACKGMCVLCGKKVGLELHHCLRQRQRFDRQLQILCNALPRLSPQRSAWKQQKVQTDTT